MGDPGPITTLGVCAGIGGIELGISLVARTRVLGYVEREAFAASVLLARMEDSSLEPAPIWCGNLEGFDARPFAGVDLVTAGLPCQPYSLAGKREGDRDERAIWPEFIRIVSECRPAMVFLENVPAFVAGGFFRRPGEELSRLGYRIERPLFLRASDLGAPHRRERVFILAWRECDAFAGESDADRRGEELADSSREREREPDDEAPAISQRGARELSRRGSDGGNGSLWPPGPAGEWTGVPEELHPARSKSSLRCMAHGLPHRLDELRALGNVVVPLMAGFAFATLAEGIRPSRFR